MKTDLFKSGFVVNPEKSRWEKDSHLGFTVDHKEGILSVTPLRIQKLNKLLDLASKDFHLSARKIARLVGSIIFMGLGIGTVARFRTRALYSNIEKAARGMKRLHHVMKRLTKQKFGNFVFMITMDSQFGLCHQLFQFCHILMSVTMDGAGTQSTLMVMCLKVIFHHMSTVIVLLGEN